MSATFGVITLQTVGRAACLVTYLDEPREEAAIVDEGKPLCKVPIHVLQAGRISARIAAEEHHHRLSLGGNEPEKEHVLATAVVALEDGVTQRAVGVQTHFLVLRSNQMVDDVRAARAAASVTEPLAARRHVASHHAGRVVHSTIAV
jgi:hypothetical protein